ncbi:MAG: hypothetical protein Q8S84_06320 [bacterium]|nr:hypothetical protein [bacterium]
MFQNNDIILFDLVISVIQKYDLKLFIIFSCSPRFFTSKSIKDLFNSEIFISTNNSLNILLVVF